MRSAWNVTATCTLAVVLMSGSTARAMTPGTSLTWLAASSPVGQFNPFKKAPPKTDPFNNPAVQMESPPAETKQKALEYLRKGREALAQRNLPGAVHYRDMATATRATFNANEDSPAKLAAEITRVRQANGTPAPDSAAPSRMPPPVGATRASAPAGLGPRYAVPQPSSVVPAGGITQPNPGSGVRLAGGIVNPAQPQRAIYQPPSDPTYNRIVSGTLTNTPPTDLRFAATAPPAPRNAQVQYVPSNEPSLYGPAAGLPPRRAPTLPGPAANTIPEHNATPEPTPATREATPEPIATGGDRNLLTETRNAEERLKLQVMSEVARQSRDALDQREKDPVAAIGMMRKTRAMVVASRLGDAEKKMLLGRVDRLLGDMENYVERHRAEIELKARNEDIMGDIARRAEYKLERQQRLAALVDEFNKLRNEQRFYEAEVIAKEARQLAPHEPVVTQMWEEIRFHIRERNNQAIKEEKETGFLSALENVDRSSIPFDDSNPIQFGDRAEWASLTQIRRKYAGDAKRKRHPAEVEIERKLTTPISMKFTDAPLSEVLDHIKRVAGVNIFLDPEGLVEEGVHPSDPVTIDLTDEISVESALNLVLRPLNLSYVIKHEVLKITSEQLRDRTVYPKTYNVADLVIPIPNFVPHDQLGIPAALQAGYNRTNMNLAGVSGGYQPPMMSVATNSRAGVATPDGVLGQASGGFASGGRAGGTAAADFDALIELVTKTIEPESWDEVGGPGSVAEFETNLSLVISQTQEVHEKIADLLEQLRRLQDLQVTIEVRFITLTDDFFEQIGIDFDFNIDDNNRSLRFDDSGRSQAFGLGFADGVPTGTPSLPGPLSLPDGLPLPGDIGVGDIQIRQGSFASAVGAFGGFNPATATTFGVAILSDIEAYFLVQAAQGDNRSNIMQSPKVTLFNGQAASISDQVQTPFVTSVTPVVGDFAAAQAPVIVVLAEGTTLSVQAVVSPDRRFVRLTLIPFFSEIRDVQEFTFTGSSTSTVAGSDSNAAGVDSTSSSSSADISTFTQGTTIQLPTFAFTTVTTTVSVPDGGTVLLGGIKRLSENRTELGTPFLSKIPYVSRLFKNVGVGRETSSLMLMVTPRIIIQEEEEEKMGLALP